MMDFSDALRQLKAGKRLARAGWNGKGMYIHISPADWLPSGIQYDAYLRMKTVQKSYVPWVASQTDILAEDWEIVE